MTRRRSGAPTANKRRRRLPRGLPEVEYRDGLHLSGSILWLDASRARDLSFVSHAHAAGVAPHRKILTTEGTRNLLAATSPAMAAKLDRAQVLTCPYGRRFALGQLDVELLPAGHVLGSASLWLRNAEGRTLLYAGSVCLQRRATCEPAEVRRADVLVIDNTFAARRFSFPSESEIAVALTRWARETLESGDTPVVLARTLGTAQEVAHLCVEAGLSVRAHPSIHRFQRVFADAGVNIPLRRLGRNATADDAVILHPFNARRPLDPERFPRARTALVSGWAALQEVAMRARVHVAFALPDRVGFEDLLRYVDVVEPSVVYVTARPAPELKEALESRGIHMRMATRPVQLDLFGES